MRKASIWLLALLIGGCNGCQQPKAKEITADETAALKKRIADARAAGKDVNLLMDNGVNLRIEKDQLVDMKTNQAFTGNVEAVIANTDAKQRVEGKMVNGKWEGNYAVYFKKEGGGEYVGVKRTYKGGEQTGSSFAYFPNGKTQAEFRFGDSGKMICAINYNEGGTKTVDTCANAAPTPAQTNPATPAPKPN
jgi:antitoxin component YwqK of YwqJK toxin-antitoxin module